jgi:hypothetical protein
MVFQIYIMNEKIVVRILVSSDVALAEEIEAEIGLKADGVWQKGNLRPKTIIREANSGWMIANEFPVDTEVGEAISVVLRRLGPAGENLRTMGPSYLRELSVVIYCAQLPTINLSPVVIKTLGAYGLGLDYDLYGVKEAAAE